MDRPNKHQPKTPQVETPGQSAEQQGLPGKSVGGDREWAQNRIANFFKGQQAGRIQRKPQDGASSPAAGKGSGEQKAQHPSGQTLADACMADTGTAKQKYQDVMHEMQPRAVAVRPQFIEGATKKMHDGAPPLQAMRNEVTSNGQKYLCLGAVIPEQALVGSNGISRVLDLPSVYGFKFVKPEFSQKNAVFSEEDFLERVREGKFDPSRDLEEETPLRGRAEQTWWFASSAGTSVDLDKLRKQLFIEEYPSYAKGVVRLDMPAAEIKAAGVEVFKPTSFDGMTQGTDADAMWKHSAHEHWGLTKNGTPEAVMKMMTLKHFKHRSMILPPGKAAAHAGSPDGAASSGKAAAHAGAPDGAATKNAPKGGGGANHG